MRYYFISLILILSLCACQTEKEMAENAKPSASAPIKEKVSQKDNKRAAEYNVQLGIAYLQQGKPERAKTKMMHAYKLEPKSPTVLAAMGYFWEATGELARAEEFYRKAVNLDPKKGAAQNNYGAFLCRHGRYKEAEAHFLIAVKDPDYPTPGEAYENAGLCAMHIGAMEKSEHFFTMALQRQPQLPNSLLELAQISYDKADYELAKKYFGRYQQLQKPTAESLWLGIRIAWQMDDQDSTKKYAALLKSQFASSNEYKDFLEAEKVT